MEKPSRKRLLVLALYALFFTIPIAIAAQPTAYSPVFDFSDFTTSNPEDQQPGVSLDTEFNAIKLTTDQIRTNLALIQRDDGALANSIVTNASLSPALAAELGVASVWVTETAYAVGDLVFTNNSLYQCLIAHTSGTFSTDLAAMKWQLVVTYETSGFNISALVTETTVDVAADFLPFSDTSESGGTNNKMTFQTLWNTLTSLTAETAPDVADQIPLYDASATSTDKVTLANLFKVTNGLTEDTAPAGATDFIPTYDTSATSAKKITPNTLLGLVNGLTEDTTPAGTADFLLSYDTSATAPKKVSPANLLKTINDLTADASPDTAADYAVTYDASAGTAKKVLLSLLAGTGGEIAGVQFFTANGTWTKEDGATKALVIVVGGGGGGGGADASSTAGACGGGGGGGGTVIEWIPSGLGTTESVTIGAAGTAGDASGSTGGTGGNSLFGAFNQATGGQGGVGSGSNTNTTTPGNNGGPAGVGSSGDLNIRGGPGGACAIETTSKFIGAAGGSSLFSGGGQAQVQQTTTDLVGDSGGGYGGGGGGATDDDNAGSAGGVGTSGAVLVISVK